MNSTELIKEALESYNNYEDGKFEKKSYMNGYYDARLKVSQMQLPVKPEIAETKARIEELERVLRLNVGKNYTVFLMIPRVDITGKIIKLKKQLAGQ